MTRGINQTLLSCWRAGASSAGLSIGNVTRTAVLATAIMGLLCPGIVLAQAPGPPGNPVPVSGATNVPTTTALTWSAVAGVTRYEVRLGTTSTPPLVQRNLNATTYQPSSPLVPGTTYYWQIEARGRGNVTTPGPVWTFTTAAAPAPPPSAPALPVPAAGATNVAVTASVAWAASTGATAYDVAFGTTNPPAIVSSNQATTSYDPPGDLAHSTTYYWRVTAKGTGGSTLGPLWSFTTAAAAPPPPPPPPPPGSTTLDRLRLMTWNVQGGKNATGVMEIEAQAELMADSGAHVLVLQEVTITSQANLAALFESRLEALTGQPWTAVWSPAPWPSTVPAEGNLILTTLPVAESSVLQIDSAPWDPGWLDTKRSAVRVAVIVNDVKVHVFGTHLAIDAAHRQLQLDTLQSWIGTFETPRLAGGDFNMVQGDGAHTDMAGTFTDVWTTIAAGDQGFTMDARSSAGNQPGRIDYWWQEKVDTRARGTEIWVVKTTRSDHHAVVVDVQVQ